MVRTKRRRKHASHLRVTPSPTQRWDFVSDSTADGRSLRVLTVIDTHTRECLVLEVDRSLCAPQVTAALDRVIAVRGRPQMITCDNGTEFTSNHFDAGPAVEASRSTSFSLAFRWRTA